MILVESPLGLFSHKKLSLSGERDWEWIVAAEGAEVDDLVYTDRSKWLTGNQIIHKGVDDEYAIKVVHHVKVSILKCLTGGIALSTDCIYTVLTFHGYVAGFLDFNSSKIGATLGAELDIRVRIRTIGALFHKIISYRMQLELKVRPI